MSFKITGDNSGAMSALNQIDNKVKGVGHSIQQALGDKFREALTVAGITEAVRRTGEWAENTMKAAQALGVTAKNYQAMALAAERAHVSVGKVENWYNKMDMAARKAANGNVKFQKSLEDLGVSKELQQTGTPEDLMSAAMRGMNRPGGQQAIIDIFGAKDYKNISSYNRQTKGMTMEEYAKENASQIVGNVSELGTAWDQIKEDLTSLGNNLSGVFKVLLAIVDGILKMFNGLVGSLKIIPGFFGNLGKGGDQGKFDEATIRSGTVGRSFLNSFSQMAGGVASLATFGKVKGDWNFVKTGRQAYGSALSDEAYRESEGAGEGIGFLSTFGFGSIAKGLGYGGKALSAGAKFARAEGAADKIAAVSKSVSAFGEGTILGGSVAGKVSDKILRKITLSYFRKNKAKLYAEFEKSTGFVDEGFTRFKDVDARNQLFKEWFDKQSGAKRLELFRKVGVAIPELASLGVAGKIGSADIASKIKGSDSATVINRLNNGVGAGALAGFGGSGNLSIGGTFGVDIQSKIAELNQQSVDLLTQIERNTNPDNNNNDGETGSDI